VLVTSQCKKRRGFTLIEILIVLVLIALTATLVVPSGQKVYQDAMNHFERLDGNISLKKARFKAFIMEQNQTYKGNQISDRGLVH